MLLKIGNCDHIVNSLSIDGLNCQQIKTENVKCNWSLSDSKGSFYELNPESATDLLFNFEANITALVKIHREVNGKITFFADYVVVGWGQVIRV